MAERFEMAGDPLTLRRSLEQNARRRPLAQDGREPLATGHDAAFDQLTVRREDTQLALAFVQVDPYAIHGWPPGWLCGTDRV